MPRPVNNAARKAALHTPKTVKTSPLPTRPYDGIEKIANEAVGLKQYEVTAPRTLICAMAPTPIGPKSTEYAPAHAVPGKSARIPFDVEDILAATRRMNEDAALLLDDEDDEDDEVIEPDAGDDQETEEEKADRARYERLARAQMGDYLDDVRADGYLI